MMYEFNNDDVKFGIAFSGDISGGGWANNLEKIINSKIIPNKFKRENKEINWNYSEIDFLIEKNSIRFKLEIDKVDTISLILLSESTEENKQKLREWATIIAQEVEKLKSK